jgi:starch synthase (maltosyl-transferring)
MMELGQCRVVIERVMPSVDEGLYPAKKIVGDEVRVTASIYADAYDLLNAHLLYRKVGDKKWQERPMHFLANDEAEAFFVVAELGMYEFTVEAWVDYPLTWQHTLRKNAAAGKPLAVLLTDGIVHLKNLVARTKGKDKDWLKDLIERIENDDAQPATAIADATGRNLERLLRAYPAKQHALLYPKCLCVWADRPKAAFSTWYEFFPRSAAQQQGKHGTFADCAEQLDRIAQMGFDVVYLPPIHPIGVPHRRGKNNNDTPAKDDYGSPWAVADHRAVHPLLGTLADFDDLVAAAHKHHIEIAMDFSLWCAPDHPYVQSHPQWFKWRSDGTVQCAENPPHKYPDILPFYFETTDWQNLWNELLDIARFWAQKGVRIFRVDNPHTKPFRFWAWFIARLQAEYPDVILLAEAFTRPNIMLHLSKIGFSQSYTYFIWRNTKAELTEYITQLTTSPQREYFRPNFWTNTPDINPFILQGGNETLFAIRYILASTLSSSYGIYGPVFEHYIHAAIPGKEEYLNSEKYECYHWDWKRTTSLSLLITLINNIRRQNPALQRTDNITLCHIDNDQLLCFLKQTPDRTNQLLICITLDPFQNQSGWLQTPLHQIGSTEGLPLRLHDLVTDNTYTWSKEWNYIELRPASPVHIFTLEIAE